MFCFNQSLFTDLLSFSFHADAVVAVFQNDQRNKLIYELLFFDLQQPVQHLIIFAAIFLSVLLMAVARQ